MFTDGWAGYNGLVDVGYDRHYRVNHGANEFSKGNGVHVNGIAPAFAKATADIEVFGVFAKEDWLNLTGLR